MSSKIQTIFIVIVFSTAAFAEWTPITSSPSYIINDIVNADGVVFLAHYGDGVYRSIDSTAS